ncbi:MAG: hypothetical protein AABM33_15220 [Pseudomonadota bacterium]
MEYEIDYSALKELQANLARNPAVVRKHLLAAVTEADNLLLREVKERMPKGAQEFLYRSVFNEERVSDTGVIGLVSSPMSYAVAVELGTKPHFPPLQPLVDWVQHSQHFGGVSDAKVARGIAFLIARKISRVGTKAQRPFGLTFQAQESQVRTIFDAAAARIAADIAGTRVA